MITATRRDREPGLKRALLEACDSNATESEIYRSKSMPRLNVVEPEQATGDVKEIYEVFEKKLGKVINIFD